MKKRPENQNKDIMLMDCSPQKPRGRNKTALPEQQLQLIATTAMKDKEKFDEQTPPAEILAAGDQALTPQAVVKHDAISITVAAVRFTKRVHMRSRELQKFKRLVKNRPEVSEPEGIRERLIFMKKVQDLMTDNDIPFSYNTLQISIPLLDEELTIRVTKTPQGASIKVEKEEEVRTIHTLIAAKEVTFHLASNVEKE